ncbi:glycosyltransferase family 4 protein [Flavobacterium suzhouense]|uniref:Glycosyltransferase family 4 protein n=1 Tax=Flavobacterium suzhouense TaxID=1529638 RepID=A0ABW5NW89_9FLAO
MNKVKAIVDSVYITKRKNRISDLLRLEPLQAASRQSLQDVVFSEEYDMVVLESESVADVLNNRTLKASKIVLRVHNDETKYFFQLGNSSSNIFKKLYYYLDALKFRRFSKNVFAKADRLWFISKDEYKAFAEQEQWSQKSSHLPSASAQLPVQQKLGGRKVLFIGSLFMPNNINAIKWYLDNVHFKLIKDFPDYSFVIVGSTGDVREEDVLSMLSGYSNAEVHFNVPDLAPFYAEAALFVNPMQFGTGVKLKSLNAINNGLPLVSTHVGSEGIGLIDKEMFLKADNPDDFYAAIALIFSTKPEANSEMVKKAQDFLNNSDYLTLLKKETDDLFKQD